MKNSLRFFVFSFTIAVATIVLGAGMPALDVTVSGAGGQVAYKGTTKADGTFATAILPPGDYVVQFNARKSLPGEYGFVLSAGKQKVMSDAVAGAKLSQGGVAMRLKVGKGLNIAGRVTSGDLTRNVTGQGNAKVKIVKGKRFVWRGPETGSHLGGRWVEEGTPSSVIRAGADTTGTARGTSER
jgi:hypothetical protein